MIQTGTEDNGAIPLLALWMLVATTIAARFQEMQVGGSDGGAKFSLCEEIR